MNHPKDGFLTMKRINTAAYTTLPSVFCISSAIMAVAKLPLAARHLWHSRYVVLSLRSHLLNIRLAASYSKSVLWGRTVVAIPMPPRPAFITWIRGAKRVFTHKMRMGEGEGCIVGGFFESTVSSGLGKSWQADA